jgi:hypothetical protein
LSTQFTARSNGHSDRHEPLFVVAPRSPATTPALLEHLDDVRLVLGSLADEIEAVLLRVDAVLIRVDKASEFVGYRVEAARARERRRNRRGQRKAAR